MPLFKSTIEKFSMDNLKFSLIIPAYNVENQISKCLNSLYNQDLPQEEYEIIIVDDGSSDNTYHFVEKLIENKKNTVLLTQENQKQGAARNNALNIARGEYVWFIDSDDYIEDNVLKTLYELSKIEDLDLLCFNNYRVFNNNVVTTNNKLLLKNISFGTVYSGQEVIRHKSIYCGPCFCVYKRDFLELHGLRFKEGLFYEDNEFMLRVYHFAERVYYIDKSLYYVVLTDSSATRTLSSIPIFNIIEIFHYMYDFVKSIKDSSISKKNYYYYVAMTFNTAVMKLKKQSFSTKEQFIREVLPIKKMIKDSMIKSGYSKYIVGGIIFSFSIRLYINLYVNLYSPTLTDSL